MKPNGSGEDLISCGFVSPLGCLSCGYSIMKNSFLYLILLGHPVLSHFALLGHL